jgi:hypothetical protein
MDTRPYVVMRRVRELRQRMARGDIQLKSRHKRFQREKQDIEHEEKQHREEIDRRYHRRRTGERIKGRCWGIVVMPSCRDPRGMGRGMQLADDTHHHGYANA